MLHEEVPWFVRSLESFRERSAGRAMTDVAAWALTMTRARTVGMTQTADIRIRKVADRPAQVSGVAHE